MFRKLCVPVVNESLSRAAAKAAISLAQRLDAEVLLTNLYALPLLHFSQDADSVRQELRSDSLALLEQLADYARQHEIRVSVLPLEVEGGAVAATIAKIAEDERCDMIVLGTHARTGLNRLLLGSVAEAVTRYSSLPVLLYRSDTAKPFSCERILVALDGFESSLAALEAAHQFARQLPAAIDVLHVVPDVLVYSDPMLATLDTDRYTTHFAEYGKSVLAKAEMSLSDISNKTIMLEQAKGRRIADVILEHAKTNQNDLVVLGTHGYSGLERLLLGSVAQAVAHHATVPVLLVRQTLPIKNPDAPLQLQTKPL
ncbi:MAG: universal stress protein [Deinococcales bacterium]